MQKLAIRAAMLVAVICLSSCSGDKPNVPDLSFISAQQWEQLSRRAIYFGHQSVGENILDGLRDIAAENPQISLKIVSGTASGPSAGFREFTVGQNGDTESKNAAFIAATEGALGPSPVVMFKYCYVDTGEETNAQALFDKYKKTIAAVRARHGDATVVHFTLPLVAESSRLRYYLNAMRGIATTRGENARRNEYNELMRKEFAHEPIFDLAAIESTHADGTRETSVLDGKTVYALAPEWTTDGGHLNTAGRKRAAQQLLVTLASLPALKDASGGGATR